MENPLKEYGVSDDDMRAIQAVQRTDIRRSLARRERASAKDASAIENAIAVQVLAPGASISPTMAKLLTELLLGLSKYQRAHGTVNPRSSDFTERDEMVFRNASPGLARKAMDLPADVRLRLRSLV
jgi:hypothetical protein